MSAPASATLAAVAGERVLVVDDEPDIVALVVYHLAKAGYRVSSAAAGPDALTLARREHPALIVLDLMLPGMSGFDVLEELQRDDATRNPSSSRPIPPGADHARQVTLHPTDRPSRRCRADPWISRMTRAGVKLWH